LQDSDHDETGRPSGDGVRYERAGEPATPDRRDAEPRQDVARPSLPAGGVAGSEFDYSVSRAEKTVGQLLDEIRASQGDAVTTRPSPAAEAQQRSPEEVVGEVLITAHRAAESMIEKARREAEAVLAQARNGTLPIFADARRALEEAGRLHDDARAIVERARTEARAELSAARAERERLIGDSVGEATQRRAELEVENLRLETAIKSLRSEWVGRAAAALARLDGIGLESAPHPTDAPSPVTTPAGHGPDQRSAGALHEREVVDELRSQLPGSTGVPSSPAQDRFV
jgi:hypothetical protein